MCAPSQALGISHRLPASDGRDGACYLGELQAVAVPYRNSLGLEEQHGDKGL